MGIISSKLLPHLAACQWHLAVLGLHGTFERLWHSSVQELWQVL